MLIEAILLFHSSLRQVILVQIDLILALLVFIAIPFLIEARRKARSIPGEQSGSRPIRVIRPVSEDEVIAEFLKSDFRHPRFMEYHNSHGSIVAQPNLDDPAENAERRALLFKRHLPLWTEIPKGTSWYEVEINRPEIGLIRAFPRAQWRKLARGNYSMTEVAGRVRKQRKSLPNQFLSKIDQIAADISRGRNGFGAVILIGRSDSEPLTVLDGNHRLVAALQSDPAQVESLKFMCGLSPKMELCCWYRTSMITLCRYGWHRLARAVRGREKEIARMAVEPVPDRPDEDLEREAVQASSN